MQKHPRTVRGLSALAVGAVVVASVGLAATASAAVKAAPVKSAPVKAAPLRSAVTVTPKGLETGTGCTSAAGVATCTLFAKAGTPTIGGVALPVWNFTAAAADTVTGANPVLVVNEGDTVTVSVTNALTIPVSLAIPGMTGLASDYTGIAPAGTQAYTFTASRAGTFLYQAGHLLTHPTPTTLGPDYGPREVAMGLAGALIVRPTGFNPAAPTDLDAAPSGSTYPANAFDDEAALVLSEIDPAFAAAPLTYDLRSFHGTYRLINGRAFPNTGVVSTGLGRKVLLRYVNAGVISHSMGALGVRQNVVALDASASTGAGLVADTIAAGETEDALVTVPAAGSGTWPVYDTSGQLDTNGQIDAATLGATPTRQLGFGGMMTLLSTSIADTTADTVGPTSMIDTVVDNPAKSTVAVTVTAHFSDPVVTVGAPPQTIPGSAISAAEIVLDNPGGVTPGSGIPFTVASSGATTATGTATISPAVLATLSQGTHQIFVRAADSTSPAANWGAPTAATLTLAVTGATTSGVSLNPNPTNGSADVVLSATGDDTALGGTVDSAGYTIDGGSSNPMTLSAAGSAITAESATIPSATVSSLSEGPHTVAVITHDSFNLSGPPANVVLHVDKTGPSVNSGSVTPSPNNGTVGSAVDSTSLLVQGSFTDTLTNGEQSALVAAEGFLQKPDLAACGSAILPCANGTGFVFVATDGTWNSTTEAAYGLIPLSELTAYGTGTFTVWIHAKDAAGNWGPLSPETFVVDKSGPVVSGLAFTQTGVGAGTLTGTATDNAATIGAAEWFVGADPGKGAGHALTVTSAGPTSATLSGSVTGLATGANVISVRAKDSLGNWGAVVTLTVTVLANQIFTDTFGTTAGAAGAPWTVTGAPTRVAVAAGLNLNGPVALRTVSGSTNSNVTTPVVAPVATGYRVRFMFRPDTLVTGTAGNYVSIFSGRSGATERVGVQYQRTSSGASAMVRLVVNGTPFGSWYTLGTAAATYTIRVDWSAGATAAIRLYANTTLGATPTLRQTITANTAGQTIDRGALGTITGVGTVTGQAYFDNYTANRYTLP